MAVVEVDRPQVMAYRVAVQGLDRESAEPAVLDLGVQDTPYGLAVSSGRRSRADGCRFPPRTPPGR